MSRHIILGAEVVWIKSIHISNYKGFSDTGPIDLDPKWNVVVGQNNSGKTSLMECFRFLRIENKPHKSIKFSEDHVYDEKSYVLPTISLSAREQNILTRRRGGRIQIPIPPGISGNDEAIKAFIDKYYSIDRDFHIMCQGNSVFSSRSYPAHGLFEDHGTPTSAAIDIAPDLTHTRGGTGTNRNDDIVNFIQHSVEQHVYVFNAERYSIGTCQVSESTHLNPNAINLGSVLVQLSARRDLYRRYNENVTKIFPNIHWVSGIIIPNNRIEIRVSTTKSEANRDDLSVSLNECGTGVGQVLAMLYVAMTQPAGVIVIDEPNSFLHPGAAKKLIQILKKYDQHQYIISTHSPEVISSAQPATLHLVKSDGIESVIETHNDSTVDVTRSMLEEIGSSLSDAFGAENVVWVEGPTERICFDLVASACFDGPIVGLSFLSLRNTGDFEKKGTDPNAVLEIYEALSRGGAILPVTVAFSFDGEERTKMQCDDLIRRCGGKAKILPRRMTENYLLVSDAIAQVLTELEGESIDAGTIEDLIQSLGPARLPKGLNASVGSEEFMRSVDGARLLDDIFQHATSGRQEYRKTRDAAAILGVVLNRNREPVQGLIAHVGDLIAPCRS